MPSFGVTDAGFVLPSQQDLLALVVADQKATIGQSLDTSSDSPIGQLNGVFTRQLEQAYEGLQVAYNSNDPDAVEGFLQTQLAALTGTARDSAFASQVTLTCLLVSGTTLVAGTTLAGIAGDPLSQWTPIVSFTAPTDGSFGVLFESTTTGPNPAAANAITVRTTPLTGWNDVYNAAPAILGANVEQDSALRLRREQELQGGGAGNVDAIRAALLKINEPLGPFVASAFVLNNFTDFPDANGVPPHSTEAVVYTPASSTALDNAIAQALWDNGASGIRNAGSASGTATDTLGNAHAVAFTRVTQVPVYIAFGLTPRTKYPGDAQFKTLVAAICAGSVPLTSDQISFGVGASVDPYDVITNTVGLGAAVTGLTLGLTAPVGTPTTIAPGIIAVGPRSIAVFSSLNITVNGS